MNQPITQLTPEQQALIPIIRDEWIKICLDTSPTDKEKAEAAVRLAYECAGLKPPSQILWFNNPLEAVIYYRDYTNNTAINSPKDFLINVFPNIHKNIKKCLDEDAWEEACNKIYKTVRNVINSVPTGLEIAVFEALSETSKEKSSYVYYNIFIDWFNQKAWLAFCAYLHSIGVDCSELKGLWETAKHCGWWWPFQDIAILTPKPSAIRLDNEGRLHAEGLPAIAYQGYNIYAYHGVILPEKYGKVHPKTGNPNGY